MNNKKIGQDELNAFVDGELDNRASEDILASLDSNSDLRAEICDIHRVNDLLSFAYPLEETQAAVASTIASKNYLAIAASFLLVLVVGFMAGNLSPGFLGSPLSVTDNELAVAIPQGEVTSNKVIIYLGSSQKEKFDQTLDKAESLLTDYKKKGTEVFVVTSAGGIDLLRTSNVSAQKRIKTMSGLYKGLHFVACNTQIYQLHKKGKDVHLVDEAEVAPSAVQFVVDHLKDGWKYIAI